MARWLEGLALTPNPSPNPPKTAGRGEQEKMRIGVIILGWSKDNFKELASQAMIAISRDLRQRETPAEDLLWEVLRDRKLANLKFRRQHPIPGTTYVVDFYCHQAQLVIEVDGGIHTIQKKADQERQATIESKGCCVIRFTNDQVMSDLASVLHRIVNFTQSISHQNI